VTILAVVVFAALFLMFLRKLFLLGKSKSGPIERDLPMDVDRLMKRLLLCGALTGGSLASPLIGTAAGYLLVIAFAFCGAVMSIPVGATAYLIPRIFR
jgi:hypothetical protein